MSTGDHIIFIDGSYVRIQKSAISGSSHIPGLQDTSRYPRFRIDIGRLVESLRRNRTHGTSFVYDSSLPHDDSVWESFARNKPYIYDRDHSDKNNEVEKSMSVDMARNATELGVRAKYNPQLAEKKDMTRFVVVTGDRDMIPAVKCVLECNIRVELWGWKSGIAKEFLNLAANNNLLSVHWLDLIFNDICFTAGSKALMTSTANKDRCMHGTQSQVAVE
jgi:hypothetical protein